MRRVRLLNRALWALLALVVLGTAGWLGVELARIHAPADPLAVPRLAVAPLPSELALADAPGRNPFDPSGAPWRPAEPQARAQGGALQGVVILPGKRGVMTSSGFVAAGEDFAGGKLKQIEPHRVVVEGGAGERVIPLGEDHSELLQQLLPGHGAREVQGRQTR